MPGYFFIMSLKVGLTGGIGSGKSVVARMFKTLGIPVYDADSATRKLYFADPDLRRQLILAFGEALYANERFDSAQLAKIVFHDPEKLQQLNQIVHPAAIKEAERWMNAQQAPYLVKEAALIFESGSQRDLDLVIGVTAPMELRIKRVMQRDGLSRDDILIRMKRQIDEPIKMRLCDYVIINDDKTLLIPQVVAMHEQFLTRAHRN